MFVPPGVHREATAGAAPTTVVVVGGRPGAALPVSPFEYWYAAEPAYQAGDFDEAVAIAREGLADYPDHPHLNYQLACYEARAGNTDAALAHLEIASRDERVPRWAAGDDDFTSLRDDERFTRYCSPARRAPQRKSIACANVRECHPKPQPQTSECSSRRLFGDWAVTARKTARSNILSPAMEVAFRPQLSGL